MSSGFRRAVSKSDSVCYTIDGRSIDRVLRDDWRLPSPFHASRLLLGLNDGRSQANSNSLIRVAAIAEDCMNKKLYVGNLAYSVTSSDLEQMFSSHGQIRSAEVIMDRASGRSKGFGFVEMETDEEAQAAIAAMNGQQHEGRALTVNEAKPREDRSGGGGGGYNRRRY